MTTWESWSTDQSLQTFSPVKMQNKNRSIVSSQLGAFAENVAHELGNVVCWECVEHGSCLEIGLGSDWLVWTLLTSCWISKDSTKPMLALETNNYIFACLGFQNCHKEKVFEKWSISWHKFAAFLPQRWNVVLRTLFAHSSSTRDKIVFENDAWYMAKNNLFWVIAANRPIIFFLTCLFSPHKTPTKTHNLTLTQKKNKTRLLVSFVFFFFLQFVGPKNKQTKTKKRKTHLFWENVVFLQCQSSDFWEQHFDLLGKFKFFLFVFICFSLWLQQMGVKKQVELRQTWSNINQMKVQDKKNCSTWRW